ncbi:MAG: PD40 domain-containing protein [Phycisphaerae bacterium]|nr:PD40 domain-containing protein [Phycisphaerae bacterium]
MTPVPRADCPTARCEGTRGRRTLGVLAGVWLLGGVDLCMSALAAHCGLLNVDDECNPLAALVLPFGLGALLAYKVILSAAGSVALVAYRGRRAAEIAAVAGLTLYAGVGAHWVVFYGLYAPFRDVSLRIESFCHAAGQLGCVVLLFLVTVLGVAAAFSRRRGLYDRVDSRVQGPIGVRIALLCVLVLSLIPLSCSPARSQPALKGRPMSGTVYYRDRWDSDGRLWCMSADGTDRRALPIGVCGEPSRHTHGGHRWFLTVREIPGETYPDGRLRRELFAVRDDALSSIQLTDRAELEPAPFSPRWPSHADDRVVSWIARRWGPDGRVADGGLYTADIVFRSDGRVAGPAEAPGEPVLRFDLAVCSEEESWWQAPAPDVRSLDWSPDGTAVVYDTTRSELRITDVATGRTSGLTRTPARHPVWSPDGTRIAFKVSRSLGPLATIGSRGTDERTVVECRSDEVFGVGEPIWSPDGTGLIYQKVSFRRTIEAAADVDLWRAAADGTEHTRLTGDTGGYLIPVAWR